MFPPDSMNGVQLLWMADRHARQFEAKHVAA